MFASWLATGENFGNYAATEEKRQWILNNIEALRGKDLICWCWPMPCHAEELAHLANVKM